MKKSLSVLIAIAVVCMAGHAVAADKIGFINMQKIIMESDAGKVATKEFRGELDKRQADIQKLEESLEQAKQELEKQRLILKEEAYREKEVEYQKKVRDYKRFVEDSNQEMSRKDQELSQKLIPDILAVAQTIGKRDGYTVVIDVASSKGLVYFAEGNDITQKVIDQYNKEYRSKQ